MTKISLEYLRRTPDTSVAEQACNDFVFQQIKVTA